MINLRELRLARGKTQKDMAEYLGIDRTTYVKYETGSSEPNIEAINKLADYFSVTTDYLLGKTNNMHPANELDDFQFAMYGEMRDLSEDRVHSYGC